MPSYLFINGPIYPMCSARIDGGALLTLDSEVDYLGPIDGLDPRLKDEAQVIDLDGRPLFPGFCDGHLHLPMTAELHAAIDCKQVTELSRLQELLRERATRTEPGQWIEGFGWQRKHLLGSHPPTTEVLDRAVPHHPVLLISNDMHSAWLNSAGWQRLRSLARLPDKCVLQQQTGLVLEDVMTLRQLLVPPLPDEQRQTALGPFIRRLLSFGITAVHCNESPEDLQLFWSHLSSSTDRVRVLANIVLDSPEALLQHQELFEQSIDGWLHPGGVKLYMDGALGSLSAAVSQPYRGTEDLGLLNMDHQELDRWLAAMQRVGTYGVFHAIGDRAVETVLDGLDRFCWPEGTRHRLEHAQLLSELIVKRDLSRMIFSVQPSHMWGDREICERHVAPELVQTYAYAYRTMQQKGGVVVFGSDAPVEDVDPYRGIAAAVTRLQDERSPPFIATEALSLIEALAAHTANPWQVHGRYFSSGILGRGSKADLVVLDQDPLARGDALPPDSFSVSMTFVDGEPVYVAA